MSSTPEPRSPAITLDQLIALNDEILALTRCGVPLETGLADLGRDLPWGLGRLSTAVAARLERGENLADVLADSGGKFPPVYSAVVQAGIRSGRLTVALEGLANSSRRVAELRRMVGLALVYPLLVLTLACGLFAFAVPRMAGHLVRTYEAQQVPVPRGFATVAWLFQSWGPWAQAVPVVAIGLALAWWLRSRRAATASTARFSAARLVPRVGHLLRVGRTATFLEILALLVEQQVPLPDSLRLAGKASGDAGLNESADELAGRIEQGAGQATATGSKSAIPPVVRWRISHPGSRDQMSTALRHAADTYHRRTKHLVDWLMLYLPLFLAAAIGGTATFVYAMCVMGPWLQFLTELGRVV